MSLEVLINVEIGRSDVMTQVRTRNLTVVCEFNLNGLPLHLRQKKKKKKLARWDCFVKFINYNKLAR
jgi:hypothetical protein